MDECINGNNQGEWEYLPLMTSDGQGVNEVCQRMITMLERGARDEKQLDVHAGQQSTDKEMWPRAGRQNSMKIQAVECEDPDVDEVDRKGAE